MLLHTQHSGSTYTNQKVWFIHIWQFSVGVRNPPTQIDVVIGIGQLLDFKNKLHILKTGPEIVKTC